MYKVSNILGLSTPDATTTGTVQPPEDIFVRPEPKEEQAHHHHHLLHGLIHHHDHNQQQPQQHHDQQTQQYHDQQTHPAIVTRLDFGSAIVIGARDYQEDRFTCIDNLSENKGPSYFAVFDGHGSSNFSSHSSSNLHRIIFNSESFKTGNYEQAIREGILNEDKELYKEYQEENGGSTATACIITKDTLYLGNVGDSRAILGVHNGVKVVGKRISRDHKPDDADEIARIKQAGGHVERGRVRGETSAINMSRAVGDFEFKTPLNHSNADWIASEPYVASPIPLGLSTKFCVIASDGLWNVIGDDECATLVDKMESEGHNPTSIAQSLVAMCEKVPLADNTTVIIVFFEYQQTTGIAQK